MLYMEIFAFFNVIFHLFDVIFRDFKCHKKDIFGVAKCHIFTGPICLFPSSEMKNPEDFFSISGRSVPEGGALLPRVGFTPELARAVIETQGSKATPKGTLLSEMEQKSKGFFHF